MQETIEKTKKDIEEILQNEEEHQDKKIDFILINQDTNETLTIASNGYDSMVYFAPYTIDEKNKYVSVADWEFSFDQYFFQDLQNGYQIGYITDETHYNLWNTIKEYYPDDIEYKEGVQWYLQYCANNGITKEYIDKTMNLDTPNIMNFFKGLALHETMTYKEYIIEADDTNYDNPKENIINIYKCQEDFNEKKINESISLNTIDLKQNIKEYIDDVYICKQDKNYIGFKNVKALFQTKIVDDMKYNGEIVDVIGAIKGKDAFDDRYIVRFNDGTIDDNIYSTELDFNYVNEINQKQKKSKERDER